MLESVVRKLIASKREGEHWDFKVKHHDNNADLLHDLLCLANSLYQGRRYLIFGVEDPAKGANVVGLSSVESGRKSQANYIDFIRNQHFAGSIRPEVELETLVLDGYPTGTSYDGGAPQGAFEGNAPLAQGSQHNDESPPSAQGLGHAGRRYQYAAELISRLIAHRKNVAAAARAGYVAG